MFIIEIPWVGPVDAAYALGALPRLALLHSAMPHATLGRWSYVAAVPFGIFKVADGRASWNGTILPQPPMAALRALLARYAQAGLPDAPPFTGGAIGAFAYEAAHLFERMPAVWAGSTQIDLPFYDRLFAFDHVDKRAFAIGPDEAAARAWCGHLDRKPAGVAPPAGLSWRDSRTRAGYEAQVSRVIDYIRAGDIFQANLSHKFLATPAQGADPLATYRVLHKANPAPFSALLVDGPSFIASTSPERFLRFDKGEVETRPIKGTRRREPLPGLDAAVAQSLALSEKDRAENIMITDLLRNDLSRVCKPGSVKVPVLCGIETYASVHHLTSVVTGQIRHGADNVSLIEATFPGGSITGAPKIRAMEIISELEGEPRGIYCGAIGWLGFDGNADLNIAIRTLTYDGQDLCVRAGGGITLLSDPASEYDETIAKAERILGAFPAANEDAAA